MTSRTLFIRGRPRPLPAPAPKPRRRLLRLDDLGVGWFLRVASAFGSLGFLFLLLCRLIHLFYVLLGVLCIASGVVRFTQNRLPCVWWAGQRARACYDWVSRFLLGHFHSGRFVWPGLGNTVGWLVGFLVLASERVSRRQVHD